MDSSTLCTAIGGSYTKDTVIPSKGRIWLVGGIQAGLWVGSFIALNELWYSDYPRTSFHFFNDN
ncbi:MAG: hypothetical protein ACXWCG_04340, partial [Flavitalea sp.]